MIGMYETEWKSYFDYYIRFARVFIDVGAAADGYYVLRACKLNSRIRVIAIEPLESEYKYLLRNIYANGLLGRVIPLKLALGDYCGETTIDGERVKLTTLDELSSKLLLPAISIVKIDVEGAGLSVIKGASQVIKKFKPIFFVEIHNVDEVRALQYLKSHGYTIHIRGRYAIAMPKPSPQPSTVFTKATC